MDKHMLYELTHLAKQINHVSRLVSECDFTRPRGGSWDPWIKPFEGNFPRVMPRISEWVDEARKYIEEGRGGGICECPFEFELTDLLDRFWTRADAVLAISQPLDSPSLLLPPSTFGLFKEACYRVPHWSYRVGESHIIEWLLGDEAVALVAEGNEGIFVAPAAWKLNPGDGSPYLVPMRTGGLLPRELVESPTGLPIFLDAVRRAIRAFRMKHGYCSNCCIRTLKSELFGGLCATCAGVVY